MKGKKAGRRIPRNFCIIIQEKRRIVNIEFDVNKDGNRPFGCRLYWQNC